MKESNQFCLRLNEFENNVKISWQALRNEKDFCNVTLACEDKQIQAHKVVISACSPVLMNILKLNQNPHPLIYLRRVKYKDLQNLLSFMYQGEVSIAEEDLSSFLEVADDLKIEGLSQIDKKEYVSPKRITDPEIADEVKIQGLSQIDKKEDVSKQSKPLKYDSFGPVKLLKRNRVLAVADDSNIERLLQKNKREFVSEQSEPLKNNQPNPSKLPKRKRETEIVANSDTFELQEKFEVTMDCDNDQNDPKLISENQNGVIKLEKNDSDNNLQSVSLTEGKRFSCNDCYKQFSQIGGLNRHTKEIHRGESYMCDQCDYKALRQEHLKAHSGSVHKGIRYPCDQCDYKATRKDNLKSHIKSVHKEIY